MIDIEDSVVIKQPVDRVFKFATDLNNNAKWQSDILVAEQTSDGRFGLGATYRCVNRFLGKEIESEGVISDFEPDKKCSFKFTSDSVTGENSYLFQPVNGYTKFTTVGKIKLNQFKLAGMLVGRIAKQQVRKDLKKLKRVLEESP